MKPVIVRHVETACPLPSAVSLTAFLGDAANLLLGGKVDESLLTMEQVEEYTKAKKDLAEAQAELKESVNKVMKYSQPVSLLTTPQLNQTLEAPLSKQSKLADPTARVKLATTFETTFKPSPRSYSNVAEVLFGINLQLAASGLQSVYSKVLDVSAKNAKDALEQYYTNRVNEVKRIASSFEANSNCAAKELNKAKIRKADNVLENGAVQQKVLTHGWTKSVKNMFGRGSLKNDKPACRNFAEELEHTLKKYLEAMQLETRNGSVKRDPTKVLSPAKVKRVENILKTDFGALKNTNESVVSAEVDTTHYKKRMAGYVQARLKLFCTALEKEITNIVPESEQDCRKIVMDLFVRGDLDSKENLLAAAARGNNTIYVVVEDDVTIYEPENINDNTPVIIAKYDKTAERWTSLQLKDQEGLLTLSKLETAGFTLGNLKGRTADDVAKLKAIVRNSTFRGKNI